MTSGAKWKLIAVCSVLALLALIAFLFRYDVTVRDDGVYTLDRWTGQIEGCDGVVCVKLNGDLPPVVDPPQERPQVRVKLYDGTELAFPADTGRDRVNEVARRITLCKRQRENDILSARECAIPSVEEQLNGTGWETFGG